MKKILLCFVLLMSLLLVACGGGAFDWDKTVEKLKDKGFTVSQESVTEKDLEDITTSFNISIRFDKGDFTVECTKYINLVKGDYKNSCSLTEFATAEQAKQYYDLYLKTRTEESKWKLTLLDRVVILTNSDEAMELIGRDFA